MSFHSSAVQVRGMVGPVVLAARCAPAYAWLRHRVMLLGRRFDPTGGVACDEAGGAGSRREGAQGKCLPVPGRDRVCRLSCNPLLKGAILLKEHQRMTSRERVLATLNHEEADRVPIHDSLWVAAIERWHKEGLPGARTGKEVWGLLRRSHPMARLSA